MNAMDHALKQKLWPTVRHLAGRVHPLQMGHIVPLYPDARAIFEAAGIDPLEPSPSG